MAIKGSEELVKNKMLTVRKLRPNKYKINKESKKFSSVKNWTKRQ